MEYEIIVLEEKLAAGLKTRTNNFAPDMGAKIGGLWKCFYEEGVYGRLSGKVTGKAMGLYTNYAGDEKDDYDMFVCCEVEEDAVQPENVETVIIPGGSYARFVLESPTVEATCAFWEKLWGMKLNRRFSGDFEEYQPGDGEGIECGGIHVYIALKEE